MNQMYPKEPTSLGNAEEETDRLDIGVNIISFQFRPKK